MLRRPRALVALGVPALVPVVIGAGVAATSLDPAASTPIRGLVKAVRGLADVFDLGLFDRDNPVWQAQGENAQVKTVLANYGLAAVGYLVVGRLAERIIRV